MNNNDVQSCEYYLSQIENSLKIMESAIAQIRLLLTYNDKNSNVTKTNTTGSDINKYLPESKIIATANGNIALYND